MNASNDFLQSYHFRTNVPFFLYIISIIVVYTHTLGNIKCIYSFLFFVLKLIVFIQEQRMFKTSNWLCNNRCRRLTSHREYQLWIYAFRINQLPAFSDILLDVSCRMFYTKLFNFLRYNWKLERWKIIVSNDCIPWLNIKQSHCSLILWT